MEKVAMKGNQFRIENVGPIEGLCNKNRQEENWILFV